VFVNDLRNAESPDRLLEDVFYVSSFLFHQLLNTESNTEQLNNYKRYEKSVKENLDCLHKLAKKTQASIKQVSEDFGEVEKRIVSMISNDVLNVRDEHAKLVEEWWEMTMVPLENGRIKTNVLYERFKAHHTDTSISCDMFKLTLKNILPAEKLQLPKMDKSQYTVIGYSWRDT
jgi:hypothetical protein